MNDIDGVLSQTIYRVIQESLTNALRHAQATTIDVDAGITDAEITIAISDDGIGFSHERSFGRGLTGMRERVRALDGTFELRRENDRTLVRCRLPLDTPPSAENEPSARGLATHVRNPAACIEVEQDANRFALEVKAIKQYAASMR